MPENTTRPWHPAVLPPPGFRLEHNGAVFEAIKASPNPHSRFANAFLVVWKTWCADCGCELTTMSTPKGWQELHSKRCKACRSPNSRANP